MFGFTVKSYFKTFKYIFIPLLVIAVVMVPAYLYFYFASRGDIRSMTEGFSSEMNTVSCDFNGLVDYIISAIKELPWESPWKAIGMISEGWLSDKITEFMALTNDSLYLSAMSGNIRTTSGALMGNLNVFSVAFLIGFILSYFVTMIFLRKKLCPRSIGQTIFYVVFDFILSATFIGLAVWLIGLWIHNAYVSAILLAVLYEFVSLVEAYFIHRDKRMHFKDVVNLKTVIGLLFSGMMMYIFTFGIVILLFLIPYKVVSLVLAVPVVIITIVDYELISESYVRSLRRDYDFV